MRSKAAAKPFSDTLKETASLFDSLSAATVSALPVFKASVATVGKETGSRQPCARQV